MSPNRRQFLVGAGLTGFSLVVANKILANRTQPIDNDADGSQTAGAAFRDGNSQLAASPTSKLLLRFAAIADTGSSTNNQYAVGRAMTRYHEQNPFNMVLMVGDNIYNNGEIAKIKEAFEIPYADLLKQDVKFYAALGNHDVRTTNGDRQVEYPQFNMQGQHYYTHEHGEVKFFVLETSSIVDPESTTRAAQLAWLDRELAASKARWNIVYGHHNIYSAGVYKVDAIMRRDITPILKKHKVKLWINGHDHNYQRSKPIDGTTYLVCGGGGANLYPVKPQSWTAFAQSIHSFGIVEVYQDQIVLTGINSKGEVIDRGTVNLT
jgi:3',5'-cyclic AMP phosphodiesterase CpdA